MISFDAQLLRLIADRRERGMSLDDILADLERQRAALEEEQRGSAS